MNNNGFNYQSLSFKMIKELIQNDSTPAWIKIWLYLSILQKYNRVLYPKNHYISTKLNIPLGTVKYSLGKLKNEGYIEIINPNSWKRQIKLTHLANINESDYKEIKSKNESIYHGNYGRKLFKNNIYLTDMEYQDLKEKIKDDKVLEFYLTGIDNYLDTSTLSYDSHYNMILTWILKNENQIANKKKKYEKPSHDWFIAFERSYMQNNIDNDIDLDFNWLDDEENEEEN